MVLVQTLLVQTAVPIGHAIRACSLWAGEAGESFQRRLLESVPNMHHLQNCKLPILDNRQSMRPQILYMSHSHIHFQPLDAITNRSALDGTQVSSSLSDSDLRAAAAAAQGATVAFVFITADSGEDGSIVEGNIGDRNDLQAWHNGVSQVHDLISTS